VMTMLVYMNDGWNPSEGGQLRVLYDEKHYEPYAAEIVPTMGNIFAFLRSDKSWHGHRPFAGERKVVQITWLIDDSKVAHKTRTAKWTRWLKRLNPFAA